MLQENLSFTLIEYKRIEQIFEIAKKIHAIAEQYEEKDWLFHYKPIATTLLIMASHNFKTANELINHNKITLADDTIATPENKRGVMQNFWVTYNWQFYILLNRRNFENFEKPKNKPWEEDFGDLSPKLVPAYG